ncbi:hypothetical protein ACROYT_G014616 [Oculina patagonica]
MNDLLVKIWIIAESDGTILSTHCVGCKAGLAESCSHFASVLFYIEAWIRINGKIARTQVKCTWLLPTFVNEVLYASIRNIDFSSAKKLKENLDVKIDCLTENDINDVFSHQQGQAEMGRPKDLSLSQAEMTSLFEKLNNCKIKPVALGLTEKYADQFKAKSSTVRVVSDLFESRESWDDTVTSNAVRSTTPQAVSTSNTVRSTTSKAVASTASPKEVASSPPPDSPESRISRVSTVKLNMLNTMPYEIPASIL